MLERLPRHNVLAAFVEVAFNHQAHDAGITPGHLRGHIGSHFNLLVVLLAAVGVRQVNHQLLAQARGFELLASGLHIGGAVVGLFAPAQNHMAVVVATGFKNRGLAHFGHAHKGVCRSRRHNRIHRHFGAPIGTVFKAHRATQAAGQLAVALALGGARTNRAPAHQVANKLRRQQIQKLGGHRQAQAHNLQQQLARPLQPFVDGKAVVHVRVVDVALPAHRGAGFFKVDAHHHQQVLRQGISHRLELVGIGHGLVVVVNRAGAHHHHQPVVLALQHLRNRVAAALHQALRRGGDGQPLLQQGGGEQRANRANAHIIHARGVLGLWGGF